MVEFGEILWVMRKKLLSILHSGVQACALVAGQSPSLPVIVGAEQGLVLAPVIFILFLMAATRLSRSPRKTVVYTRCVHKWSTSQ